MNHNKRGFSLVEMLVAVGLFSIVMLVATSSLLALVDANRKAQALQSVMNNLNTAVDGMVRALRMGTTYHCIDGLQPDRSVAHSCPSGELAIAFEAIGGLSGTIEVNDQWVYSYDAVAKRLYKSEDNNATKFSLTAPEVDIDSAAFYVVGAEQGDDLQPKVVIVVRGTAGADRVKTRTSFNIQATAVQRVIDI